MARQSLPSITSARHPRTLDVEARTRRYLWTMAIRTACFVAMIWVPGWWRLVLLIGAAVLPAVAVLLVNAVDRRSTPEPDDGDRPALHGGEIIRPG